MIAFGPEAHVGQRMTYSVTRLWRIRGRENAGALYSIPIRLVYFPGLQPCEPGRDGHRQPPDPAIGSPAHGTQRAEIKISPEKFSIILLEVSVVSYDYGEIRLDPICHRSSSIVRAMLVGA
jgi:hypothetical protein